jgi:tetratricopeptide (TPR) repeat protein
MRSLTLNFIVLLCGAIFSLQVLAQTAGEQESAGKDWPTAEKSYREALQANPKSGQDWFGLGEALYGQQKFSEAAQAFQKASDRGFQSMRSKYRQAKSLARAGETDRAFQELAELNRQGFPNLNALTSDADFLPLQSDRRWADVVAATTANATPCEHATENRQFDFWIGEWNVETTAGQPAGTSKVERILNGCALLENWSGGGDGKSLNIYNANRNVWSAALSQAKNEVTGWSAQMYSAFVGTQGSWP